MTILTSDQIKEERNNLSNKGFLTGTVGIKILKSILYQLYQ